MLKDLKFHSALVLGWFVLWNFYSFLPYTDINVFNKVCGFVAAWVSLKGQNFVILTN